MNKLNEIPRGSTNWTDPLNENFAELDKRHSVSSPAILLANRLYPGVNLAEKFAAEIAVPPHNGNPWSWINARTQEGNFDQINVGDWIPFTTLDGIFFEAQIAGINTYKGYGDTTDTIVKNHIDFITKDCHPDPFVMNRVNFNNGITDFTSPWLASELEARLNSRQKSVVSSAAATPTMVAVDYRTTGILDKLPQPLRAVIKNKRILAPRRFTAGSLLIDDNSWDWRDFGPLWIPSDTEVTGNGSWSTLGYDTGAFVQYPLFNCNMERVKHIGKGGLRTHWWCSSAYRGNSTHFVFVHSVGLVDSTNASHATVRVAFGFRIMES